MTQPETHASTLALLTPLQASHITFYTTTRYLAVMPGRLTLWPRDYGPLAIETARGREYVEFVYKDGSQDPIEGEPASDALPRALGQARGVHVYSSGLRLDLGNFMTNGAHTCALTQQVYTRNAGYMNEARVRSELRGFAGCDQPIVVPILPRSVGHIDEIAKFVSANTVMVVTEQPTLRTDANQAIRDARTAFSSAGFRILDLPILAPVGRHYRSYANALLHGSGVIVPQYGDATADATAVRAYQAAFPSRTVIGVRIEYILDNFGGAVHCLTMGL